MGQHEFNELLFRELVIYVAQRSADDPHFGNTKLAKLLAFIDFTSFERHQRPLTGATYIKLEFGPAPRELPRILRQLQAKRRIKVRQSDRFGYQQTCVYASDEPKLDGLLEPAQRELVDDVLARFAGWNNSEISELAHKQFVGWQMAREMEPIPYRSVLLSPLAPTEAEIERGLALAAEAKRERGL